jgi:hypothetical protein
MACALRVSLDFVAADDRAVSAFQPTPQETIASAINTWVWA